MPRPEGSGRAKGTPNKRSREFRDRLDEISSRLGFDLIETLARTAMGEDPYFPIGGAEGEPAVDAETREARRTANQGHAMTARKLLADYGFPKLKAVELEAADGEGAVIGYVLNIKRAGDNVVSPLTPDEEEVLS